MKNLSTTGIVLKKRNYKDNDKFVTILTKDFGKVTIVARGIRKITSRRAGNLDTLNRVKVTYTQNIKDHKNLSEIETLDSYKNIKNDYELQSTAFYFLELVDKALEDDDKNLKVYTLLEKILKLLDVRYTDIDLLRLYFEVNLLKDLGYQITEDFNGSLIKMLNSGKIDKNLIEDIKKTDPLVKNYIHEYIAERLKSLELV